jgi:hypothetical protein
MLEMNWKTFSAIEEEASRIQQCSELVLAIETAVVSEGGGDYANGLFNIWSQLHQAYKALQGIIENKELAGEMVKHE